jgi:hypothetical protein
MSIEVMNRVWSSSTCDGSELLVMLALGNRADDDGICWPGIKHISEKARVSERQTQNIIRRLEANGELYIETGTGRKNTNMYFVITGLSDAAITSILIDRFDYEPEEAHEIVAAIAERVKSSVEKKGEVESEKGENQRGKGEIQRREKVKRTSPDTSVKTKGDSSKRLPRTRPAPDERSKHPAILCVQGVTGYKPPKEAYEMVINALGNSPDGEKFAKVFTTWVSRGNKRTNIDGVLDWFKNGIPEPPRNGNGAKGYGGPPPNASALGYSRAR